jgi:vacuolar-type H+-ATPase subunit H
MVYINPLPRLRELRDKEERLQRCIAAMKPERDQLIRRAAADPHRYSQRTIAMAAGRSRRRIQEIVDGD